MVLGKIIVFLIVEFLVATLLSFVIKGKTNLDKVWNYVINGAVVVIMILMAVYYPFFSYSEVIDRIFEMGLFILFIAIVFLASVAVAGVRSGNWLESFRN